MSEREGQTEYTVYPLTRQELRLLLDFGAQQGRFHELAIERIETTVDNGWRDEPKPDTDSFLELARTVAFDLLEHSPSDETRLELIRRVFDGEIR